MSDDQDPSRLEKVIQVVDLLLFDRPKLPMFVYGGLFELKLN
jgi:hypothetical protein